MASVKKEEPEVKTESMEVEEKKLEIKTEPKEEDDSGANGTTSSPSQSRRKSEFYQRNNPYCLIILDGSHLSTSRIPAKLWGGEKKCDL